MTYHWLTEDNHSMMYLLDSSTRRKYHESIASNLQVATPYTILRGIFIFHSRIPAKFWSDITAYISSHYDYPPLYIHNRQTPVSIASSTVHLCYMKVQWTVLNSSASYSWSLKQPKSYYSYYSTPWELRLSCTHISI